MAAQAPGQPRDGGFGTMPGARELAVGGAGLEPGGDLLEQVEAFEVVGAREGLLGAGATAVPASETGNAAAVDCSGTS